METTYAPEPTAKNSVPPSVCPTRSPQDLADLLSELPNQTKAEFTYELVFYAALAAQETGHEALNELLAELEDMAIVDTDPARRRELRRTVREAARHAAPVTPADADTNTNENGEAP